MVVGALGTIQKIRKNTKGMDGIATHQLQCITVFGTGHILPDIFNYPKSLRCI